MAGDASPASATLSDAARRRGKRAAPSTYATPAPSSAGLSRSLWGEFQDPALEAEFWRAAAPSCVRLDSITFGIAAASFAATARRHPPPHALLMIASLWAALAAVWLARPRWAARWRLTVLPVCRVALVLIPICLIIYRHSVGTPLTWESRTPADFASVTPLQFMLKTPRTQGLLLSGFGFPLPLRRHAAASAVCVALLAATATSAASIREAYFGRDAHARFADAMSAVTRAAGLHGTPTPRVPPHRAALAFVLVSQIGFGLAGSCIMHALLTASLRRRFARARGARINEAAAAADGLLVAGAALTAIVVGSWWGLEVALGEWRRR